MESIPGKVSGARVLKGSRMPAQTIVDNHDACMDSPEIADAFEVEPRLVEAIVAFAEGYRTEALGRILAGPGFAALLDGAPQPPPVDWRGCALVEWMEGPFHDTWVLRGTTTPAHLLMKHHDDGWRLEEIVEHYRWNEALVAALIAYGERRTAPAWAPPLRGRRDERNHRGAGRAAESGAAERPPRSASAIRGPTGPLTGRRPAAPRTRR